MEPWIVNFILRDRSIEHQGEKRIVRGLHMQSRNTRLSTAPPDYLARSASYYRPLKMTHSRPDSYYITLIKIIIVTTTNDNSYVPRLVKILQNSPNNVLKRFPYTNIFDNFFLSYKPFNWDQFSFLNIFSYVQGIRPSLTCENLTLRAFCSSFQWWSTQTRSLKALWYNRLLAKKLQGRSQTLLKLLISLRYPLATRFICPRTLKQILQAFNNYIYYNNLFKTI